MYKKEYALYRGEEFIDIGTSKELAEKLNITVKSVQWYASCNRWKNTVNGRKNRITIIPLDDD